MSSLEPGRTDMTGRAPALVLVLFAGLAACGEPADERGPGELTVGEARALDDAASMLDEQRLPESPASEDDVPQPATPAP